MLADACSEAAVDCLLILYCFENNNEELREQDLHLFSYLACILSLYSQNPAAEWGYSFVGTDLGAPFSHEIDTALSSLSKRGFLSSDSQILKITPQGKKFTETVLQLQAFSERISCLQASSSVIVPYSINLVSVALAQEPDLRKSIELRQDRMLLETSAVDRIHSAFQLLREVLPAGLSDLRIPASVWLESLFQMSYGELLDA